MSESRPSENGPETGPESIIKRISEAFNDVKAIAMVYQSIYTQVVQTQWQCRNNAELTIFSCELAIKSC